MATLTERNLLKEEVIGECRNESRVADHLYGTDVAIEKKLKSDSPDANLDLLAAICLSRSSSSAKEASRNSSSQSVVNENVTAKARKEKSLGLLCFKFMRLVKESEKYPGELDLEKIVKSLDTGKRRIYDIINVLESLKIVRRFNKAKYQWIGFDSLEEHLAMLQRMGIRDGWPEIIDAADVHFRRILVKTKRSPTAEEQGKKTNFSEKSSMVNMCQRFLMLLLCSPKYELCADIAASLLSMAHTRTFNPDRLTFAYCRRLYDITNILSALGLVARETKVRVPNVKTSMLRYIGPLDFEKVAKKSAVSFDDILRAAEIERQRLTTNVFAITMADKHRKSRLDINGSATSSSLSAADLELKLHLHATTTKHKVFTKSGITCYVYKAADDKIQSLTCKNESVQKQNGFSKTNGFANNVKRFRSSDGTSVVCLNYVAKKIDC